MQIRVSIGTFNKAMIGHLSQTYFDNFCVLLMHK
jgi:hypothetical protein